MDHLSAQQLAELREVLERELVQLRTRQASDDAEAGSEQEIGDIQDKASEEARRGNALRRLAYHDARHREVEAALERMAQGTYGLCEETDEEIPFARLRAEPTSRYTVEALELLERERARREVSEHVPDDSDAY